MRTLIFYSKLSSEWIRDWDFNVKTSRIWEKSSENEQIISSQHEGVIKSSQNIEQLKPLSNLPVLILRKQISSWETSLIRLSEIENINE